MLSLVAASYASLFLSGMYIYIYEETPKGGYVNMRTYSLEFDPAEPLEARKKLLEAIISQEEMPAVALLNLEAYVQFENDLLLIRGSDEGGVRRPLLEGREFGPEEVEEAAEVALVSSLLYNDTGQLDFTGSSQTINDVEYAVIGLISSFQKEIVIPYTTFLRNNLDLASAVLIYPHQLSRSQESMLWETVENVLPSTQVMWPPKTVPETVLMFMAILCLIALLLWLCMINVLNLFRFWVERIKFRLLIYKMHGALNRQIYLIIIGEALLLGLLGFLTGLALYWATVPYLKQLGYWYPIEPEHILLIFTIYLFAIGLAISRTAGKVAKAMPTEKALWG